MAVWIFILFFACLHVSLGGAEAAPGASLDSLEHRKRAADELWSELIEGEGKADDHDHWERIVRRSVEWYDPYYSDDTLHIVNVQDYYRYVLEEQEWDEDSQQEQQEEQEELAYLLGTLLGNNNAMVQEGGINVKDVQKPIPGRYIVMLDSSADDYALDRTIEILQDAHRESEGRIRADHITPMRNLGHGFTATMNSKTVELVSRKNVEQISSLA